MGYKRPMFVFKFKKMETLSSEKVVQKNATIKTIYERRAVRKYLDKPVAKEIIEELLDAARMAPSAINKQPWRFYILTNKDTIESFSKQITKAAASHYHLAFASGIIGKNYNVFHGAPVVIFITAPKDNAWAPLDIGMCAQNIMLAAKSLGLDTCPVGFGKFVEDTEAVTKLGMSKKEKVLLSVIVGYGDEAPEIHKRDKKNAFYID